MLNPISLSLFYPTILCCHNYSIYLPYTNYHILYYIILYYIILYYIILYYIILYYIILYYIIFSPLFYTVNSMHVPGPRPASTIVVHNIHVQPPARFSAGELERCIWHRKGRRESVCGVRRRVAHCSL
jgi:hypothetical protein